MQSSIDITLHEQNGAYLPGTVYLFRDAINAVFRCGIEPRQVKSLIVHPTRRTYYTGAALELLASDRLENFCALVTYEDNADLIQGVVPVYLCDVPGLRSLYLGGLYPDLSSAVFSTLTTLTLGHWPTLPPRVNSEELFAAMSTWVSLEKLTLRHFLGITSFSDSTGTRRVLLPNLRRLVVEETPQRIQGLLGSLDLPRCTRVRVRADLSPDPPVRPDDATIDFCRGFRAILPKSGLTCFPPVLTRISVEVLTDEATLIAASDEEGERVILKVDGRLSEYARDGQMGDTVFLCGVLQTLPHILRQADLPRVRIITVKGPLRDVPDAIYLAMLGAFPGLDRFEFP